MARTYDIVIYGATGFTGRLVAEYLIGRDHGCTWAIAGRDAGRLADTAAAIGRPDLPRIVANANDEAALLSLARDTRLVIAAAGPFTLYGSALVAACSVAGTDYVDITGEVLWTRDMIDKHEAQAKASGARFLMSSGFDSIPTELGVFELQTRAAERFGGPLPYVGGRMRAFNGGMSGGSVAAGRLTGKLAADPAVRARLLDPYLLTPGFVGPRQPPSHKVRFDEALGGWLAPFMMAPINTKNLHRSNLLLGHRYGVDFTYDEMTLVGPGEEGRRRAEAMAAENYTEAPNAPDPGDGPGREEREAGSWDMLYYGIGPGGERLALSVTGDRDPGYGSTSKMVSETALHLLENTTLPGGFHTPGAAFGRQLVERMEAHAGLRFAFE